VVVVVLKAAQAGVLLELAPTRTSIPVVKVEHQVGQTLGHQLAALLGAVVVTSAPTLVVVRGGLQMVEMLPQLRAPVDTHQEIPEILGVVAMTGVAILVLVVLVEVGGYTATLEEQERGEVILVGRRRRSLLEDLVEVVLMAARQPMCTIRVKATASSHKINKYIYI